MEISQLTKEQRMLLSIQNASSSALSQLESVARQSFANIWYGGESPMKWKAPDDSILPQEEQEAALASRNEAMASFKEKARSLISAMGTKASDAFDRHAKTIEFLLSVGITIPPEYYTPPFEFVKNEDGSISLT